MNSPSSETLSTEDAVQTIGGRNTRGDKSDSPGRRNEKPYSESVFNSSGADAHVCARPPGRASCLCRLNPSAELCPKSAPVSPMRCRGLAHTVQHSQQPIGVHRRDLHSCRVDTSKDLE